MNKLLVLAIALSSSFVLAIEFVEPISKAIGSATNALSASIDNEIHIPQTALTASWSTVYDWIQAHGSPGLVHGGELSHDINNTITISNGFGLFQGEALDYTTSSVKRLKWFSWTNTAFSLPLGTSVYIYASKNSGHPHMTMQFTDEVNSETKWQMYRVFLERDGGEPYHYETYPNLKSYATRDNERLLVVRDIQLGYGLGVSFATNFFHGEAGTVYLGNNKRSVNAFYSDIAGNNFDTYYCTNMSNNSWVEIVSNRIDNTRFNSQCTNLIASSADKFICHWLYINAKNEPAFIYGVNQYDTLADAQNEPQPSLMPEHFSQFAQLVAQIITTNSAPNPIQIRTSGNFIASGATANEHDSLAGLATESHPAYLTISGDRAMLGDIDVGGNNVSNIKSVVIGNGITNGTLTIIQAPIIGTFGACAYMFGTNPPVVGASTGPAWSGRRARGTESSPIAVSNDDVLVSLAGRGYGDTKWDDLADGNMQVVASELHTDSKHGSYLSFRTKTKGTNTRTEKARVDDNGISAQRGHRLATGSYSNDEWVAYQDVVPVDGSKTWSGANITNVDAETLDGHTLAEVQALCDASNLSQQAEINAMYVSNNANLVSLNAATNALRIGEIAALYVSNKTETLRMDGIYASNNANLVSMNSATNALRIGEISALYVSNNANLVTLNSATNALSQLFYCNVWFTNLTKAYSGATNSVVSGYLYGNSNGFSYSAHDVVAKISGVMFASATLSILNDNDSESVYVSIATNNVVLPQTITRAIIPNSGRQNITTHGIFNCQSGVVCSVIITLEADVSSVSECSFSIHKL